MPVSAPLVELFKLHKGARDIPYITALNPRGAKSETAHRRMFERIKASVGIERSLTYHDLRRTTAVKAYNLLHDLRLVQSILGHKDLSHTLYYLDHNTSQVSFADIEAIRLHGANPTTETIQ